MEQRDETLAKAEVKAEKAEAKELGVSYEEFKKEQLKFVAA